MNNFRKLLILLLFTCLFSRGQSTIYHKLKDSIDDTWIMPSEELEITKPSYFNNTNLQSLFVSPLEVSGYGVPFSWDSDLSILKFLTHQDSTIVVQTGKEADTNYLGTKIRWKSTIPALLFLNKETKKSSITDWYLFGTSECPKIHLFPIVNFEELYQLDSPIRNDSKGIALFPLPIDIDEIKETTIELKSKIGNSYWGTAYDLDNDQIQDVFIYIDPDYDSNGRRQQKLFINVEGFWLLRWNNLEETQCF